MAWFTLGSIALNVLMDQVDLGTPDPIANRRTITVTIDLDGSTVDVLGTNFQNLVAELEKAKAASGAIGYGTRKYVTWQPGTTVIYYDLVPDLNGEVGYFRPSGSSFSHPNFIPQLQLVLNCTAYGRGARMQLLDGSTVYTNGPDSTIYVDGLEGDVPGLFRMLLSDQSTGGKVIQDWRIGVRSLRGLADGDYQGVVEVTPESGASTTDSDTVSTNIARLTASTSPQQLGTFSKPGAAPYTDGPLHVFARVRDHSTVAGKPTGLTAVSSGVAVSNKANYDSGVSSSTTHSITIAKPTAGNLMIVSLRSSSAYSSSNPSMTAVPSAVSPLKQLYRVADGTETTTLQITLASNGTATILYEEVSGLKTTSPLDQSNASTGSTGTTGTTAQAYEYAHATIYKLDDGNHAYSINGGFSADQSKQVYVNNEYLISLNRILTATGTYSASLGGAHVTSQSGIIATYKALASTQPSLSADTYTWRVAAVTAGGAVGEASDAVSGAVSANGAVTLNWSPASGADHYRIYGKTSAGSYAYSDTSGTDTTALITSISGWPPGEPNLSAGAVAFGQYRLKTAMGSGTIYRERDWVSTVIANANWEILYLGVMEGSQAPALWDDDPIGWKMAIDCKHPTLTPSMDLDCLWLLPADEPTLHLGYQDASGNVGGLAANRDWRYDLRPDLLQSAILLETGTTTEAGPVQHDGRSMGRPDAAAITVLALIDGLVSDVSACAFSMTLEFTPRFLYISGA